MKKAITNVSMVLYGKIVDAGSIVDVEDKDYVLLEAIGRLAPAPAPAPAKAQEAPTAPQIRVVKPSGKRKA